MAILNQHEGRVRPSAHLDPVESKIKLKTRVQRRGNQKLLELKTLFRRMYSNHMSQFLLTEYILKALVPEGSTTRY